MLSPRVPDKPNSRWSANRACASSPLSLCSYLPGPPSPPGKGPLSHSFSFPAGSCRTPSLFLSLSWGPGTLSALSFPFVALCQRACLVVICLSLCLRNRYLLGSYCAGTMLGTHHIVVKEMGLAPALMEVTVSRAGETCVNKIITQ